MNKISTTIFWPEGEVMDVEEMNFSLTFCEEKSRELCTASDLEIEWKTYKPDDSVKNLLSMCPTDFFLLVTDPEIVLHAVAIHSMAALLLKKKADAVACQFNQSDFPYQVANIPNPYLNISTYNEVVHQYHRKNKNNHEEVDELDPGCVMYKTDSARKTANELSEVSFTGLSSRPIKKMVDKSTFVHRFGNYYNGERPDLENLIPKQVETVLEVGTALGGFGKGVKKSRPDIHITGVEMNPVMAKTAEKYYDKFITAKFEEVQFNQAFDSIICGDIIEHLYNPWDVLKRMHKILKPGGNLIISIPNVGHWTVVADLLWGKFEYITVGLLCVTHIRWFTESSIRKALSDSGFEIELFERQQIPPTEEGKKFIRKMVRNKLGDEQSLLSSGFIIRAIKKPEIG